MVVPRWYHQRCFVLCFFIQPTYLGKLAICIYIYPPPHTRFFFFFFFFSLCWNSKLFLLSTCFGQGRLTCVCVHLLFFPLTPTCNYNCCRIVRIIYLFYPLCYAKRSVSFFFFFCVFFYIYTYTSFFCN